MLKDLVDDEEKLVQEVSKKIYMNKDQELNYHHRNWKKNYYYHFFNTCDEKYVNNVCNKYCEMLNWTFKYYFTGCLSWRFFYNYRAAPCLSDVFKFLGNNDLNNYNFPEDIPYTQNQQLMMILPPKSIKLIPEKYRNLTKNELVEFYPLDFRLEVVGKAVDWMHEPIIPEIEDEMILKYVRD